MEKSARSNFISGAVLSIFSAVLVLGSLRIYYQAGTEMYKSPALLPLLTSGAMLFVSLILLLKSLSGGGIRARVSETAAWFSRLAKESFTRKTILGIALMAIYVYVLLPLLPFWASSLIFMVALLAFLRAGKWWVIAITSGGLIGAIYLIFSIALRAPLP